MISGLKYSVHNELKELGVLLGNGGLLVWGVRCIFWGGRGFMLERLMCLIDLFSVLSCLAAGEATRICHVYK